MERFNLERVESVCLGANIDNRILICYCINKKIVEASMKDHQRAEMRA
jgi:hypothetical protein